MLYMGGLRLSRVEILILMNARYIRRITNVKKEGTGG
jgi:hypothetical protein